MWRLMIGMVVALVAPAFAQQNKVRPVRADVEFRTATPGDATLLELQIPDVASGRSQKRPISDLMLRVSLPRGDVEAALRLPNGTFVDRDEGLLRAHIYVVSGGRLLRDAEARCDRWVDDFAVCHLPCEGGVFGLKRRVGQATTSLSLIAGRLPRGFDEGGRLGFNISGCSESGTDPELLLAPSANPSVAEVPLKSR